MLSFFVLFQGTFKVGVGAEFTRWSPPCWGERDDVHTGQFVEPYMQLGRDDVVGYAISHACMSSPSFDRIKMLTTSLNNGEIIVTKESYDPNFIRKPYVVDLVDENGNLLPNGLNDLVARDLGLPAADRGDPRPFKFASGTAGVLIERSGYFYKLYEVSPNVSQDRSCFCSTA